MEDDYYSYAPLHRLPRPVALVGLPGAEAGRTGRTMSLLSGIPFVWVDRHVEHALGRSVELVQREQGAEARLVEERTLMATVFTRRVPHLIALSDVTYTDPGLVAAIEAQADVVLLHLDVDSAVDRIWAQHAADPKQHWALLEAGRATRPAVRDRLLALERRTRHLSHVVLVGTRTPTEVAEQLLADLGFPASS